MKTNNTHPLKQAERAAHDAFAASMRARDAINITSKAAMDEWRAAHDICKARAAEWRTATEAVHAESARLLKTGLFPYQVEELGLEFEPYWW